MATGFTGRESANLPGRCWRGDGFEGVAVRASVLALLLTTFSRAAPEEDAIYVAKMCDRVYGETATFLEELKECLEDV